MERKGEMTPLLTAMLVVGLLTGGGKAGVVRVIDRYTIEVCCVAGKQEHVRYIGIDRIGTEGCRCE